MASQGTGAVRADRARSSLLAVLAGAGSVARSRSDGAWRVLREGGVLLEEGRGHST
ncbi:hypothetical protein HMPREF1549_00715 [Actinomyces johnsonii F0510]|uniref:Uncharacterized protein n=1 Tax=Actinomyces johnsonii F0510 TaxID=1227262 RepID=U1RSA9_9ACTO|nr:hypothetical protein HMPREF1549_00715 [Actinomyces johnsonii F0510]